MSSKKLKINLSETEPTRLTTTRRQHLIDTSDIRIARSDISPIDCVKQLGVDLDSTLSVKTIVSKTATSGFYHLHQIKVVRRNLTLEAAKTLVNSLIVARLDYCNSLFVSVRQTAVGCQRCSHIDLVADTRFAIRNDLQRPVMNGIGVQGLATIYNAL